MKQINDIKRRWKFFLQYINEQWINICEWYNRKTCPHYFKAASINGKPGKFCNMCDTAIELTPEEYYSEYGEKGWRNWKK